MKTFTKSALLSATLLSFAGIANANADATIQNEYLLDETLTIAQNGAKIQNFSTLMTAVETAGLADELMGEGPFTVFAPIDSAFEALPAGTVEDLLKPENREQLVRLISAHVVPNTVLERDFDFANIDESVAPSDSVVVDIENQQIVMDTIADTEITVEKLGDNYYASASPAINDDEEPEASIIYSDLMSSNGVIHIIDSVLTPDA